MTATLRTREAIQADYTANDAGRNTADTHPDHPEFWAERTPEQQARAIALIAELDALTRSGVYDLMADTDAIFALEAESDLEQARR